VGGKILKFADDIIRFIIKLDLIANLQSDLCNLVSWSKEWQMLFYVEKCKVIHFG